jgi:hypothetical protein
MPINLPEAPKESHWVIQQKVNAIENAVRAKNELAEMVKVFFVVSTGNERYARGTVGNDIRALSESGERYIVGRISIDGDKWGRDWENFKISYDDLYNPEEYLRRHARAMAQSAQPEELDQH